MKYIVNLILISLFLISPSSGMNGNYANALELEVIEAAKEGNLAKVQALVNDPEININARDGNKNSALHWAARCGEVSVCQLLIEKETDIYAQAENNDTPLHCAASNGHVNVCKLLIEQGMPADTLNVYNSTPLHYAAHAGHAAVCKLLLEQGAAVNALNENHCTPLFAAADKGDVDVCHLLLEKGATVNAFTVYNYTPLHKAACNGHASVCKLLLEKGALVNTPACNGWTPLYSAVKADNSVHAAGDKSGYALVVELLVSYNAQVDPILLDYTILRKAQRKQEELLNARTFKKRAQLLSKGRCAGLAIQQLVDAKREILLNAVKKDNIEEVKAVLKDGFSLNTCAKDGNTLIHLAIMHNSQQVLGLLLSFYIKEENNGLWSRKNKFGLTPVEIAVACGNFELLKRLITQELPETPVKAVNNKLVDDEDSDQDYNDQACVIV